MIVKNTTLLTIVSKILDAMEAGDKPEELRLRKIALKEIADRKAPDFLRQNSEENGYACDAFAHRLLEHTLVVFSITK